MTRSLRADFHEGRSGCMGAQKNYPFEIIELAAQASSTEKTLVFRKIEGYELYLLCGSLIRHTSTCGSARARVDF